MNKLEHHIMSTLADITLQLHHDRKWTSHTVDCYSLLLICAHIQNITARKRDLLHLKANIDKV